MTALASPTSITLYSGSFDQVSRSTPSGNMPGLAQIRYPFTRELDKGSNTVALDQLPVALDVGSVQLGSNTAGLRVRSQRYDFALLDQAQLLRHAIGQRVTVTQTAGNSVQQYVGTLLATGGGLTLQQDDGKVRVLADYSGFELGQLPANLSTRPAMRWQVDSPKKGMETLHATYATGGLAWQAEYIVVLDGPKQEGKMSLSGAAQVINRSGLDYPGTQLTLVAGQPNRARAAAPNAMVMDAPAPAPMAKMSMSGAMYEGGVEAQASGEYHAYPLPTPVDLPNGSIQRLSLLDATQNIPFQRHYETGQKRLGYVPGHPQIQIYDGEETLSIMTTLAFSNEKKSGLGIPLPSGRVRVFQAENQDEALLGETYLGHLPSGQEALLTLGEAFDLSGRRRTTDTALSEDRLSLSERIELTLSNAKPYPVTLTVHELLSRWSDWEITDASHPWEKTHGQGIDFTLTLPAQQTVKVNYRVQYRWPARVRP